jgi:hypothetical protein
VCCGWSVSGNCALLSCESSATSRQAYAYDDPKVMRDDALIEKARAEHLKGKDPFEALEYVLRHFDQDQDVA